MEDAERFGALAALAASGDEDAIAAIYRRHQPRLLRILRAEVGDAADDVASQTWLEVVRTLDRFEGDERGFRSLLLTIARRRVLDHRRTGIRRPAHPVPGEDLAAAPDASPSVERLVLDRLDGDEAAARIAAIVGEVSAEVLLLRIVGGLSVDEVAAIVGRSPGAIRVQQHRALKKLAEAMEGDRDQLP